MSSENSTQTLMTPDGKKTISPIYERLGVRHGFNPGPAIRRRIVVTGVPGSGKTHFCYSFPRSIALDFEDSGRDVVNSRAQRFGPFEKNNTLTVPTLQEYSNVIDQLVADSKNPNRPFDMVIIDTIDELINLECDAFCKEYKISAVGERRREGGDWADIRNRVVSKLDSLWQANYGLLIVCHLSEKVVGKGDDAKTQYVLSVSDSFKKWLRQRSQYLFRCVAVREEIKDVKVIKNMVDGKEVTREVKTSTGKYKNSHRITTVTSGEFDDASGYKMRIPLPPVLNFGLNDGYEVYEKAYNESVALLQQQQ